MHYYNAFESREGLVKVAPKKSCRAKRVSGVSGGTFPSFLPFFLPPLPALERVKQVTEILLRHTVLFSAPFLYGDCRLEKEEKLDWIPTLSSVRNASVYEYKHITSTGKIRIVVEMEWNSACLDSTLFLVALFP